MHLAATARIHIATFRCQGCGDRILHSRKAPCPVQIIEVCGVGRTILAKRRERSEGTGRTGGVARLREPRIARRARVVIGTHDEPCLRMT